MSFSPEELLRRWFISGKRSFPWRENPDPYAVWISEIMLQQTRTGAVVGYFLRWLQKFPTINSVAEASDEELLKAWEGLGYYSRVRNIKKTAEILQNGDKGLPSEVEALRALPGIGSYTAGAIASFAFGKKAAAVDGNVARVIARYFGLEGNVKRSILEDKTLEFLPDNDPASVMEGLIELGATICGKKPACSECPLRSSCKAALQGKTETIPPPRKKLPIIEMTRKVFVIVSDNMVLVQRKEEGKVLGGLIEFPSCETSQETFFSENGIPLPLEFVRDLPEQRQYFTRFRVDLYPSLWITNDPRDVPGFFRVDLDSLASLSFSSGHKRILESWLGTDLMKLGKTDREGSLFVR